MRFSDWTSFPEADDAGPPAAGVFQVKIREGLLSYPGGKTAMFYYGYADNLRDGVSRFRKEILPFLEMRETHLLVRWMPADDMIPRFRSRLARFHTRFGSLPAGNERWLSNRERVERST